MATWGTVEEWRKVQWKQEKMLNSLKTFKICNEVEQLLFLLCGPIGAGKSSTINTIKTIFEGRQFVSCLAASGSSTHTLHLSQYNDYENASFPFTLNDVMGIEASEGVQTDDIISALKGHIKEGYVFNSKAPIAESNIYYNKDPSLNDQMHCLVYVIPANMISVMDNDFISKFICVSKIANKMGE
ncbi:interferon-induced protein 44-like [Hemibagrus wyckioides]|uniref:interferon-induced protein 44-like n=1 Tax=Hemibagrus wyckioides TaxID=337641 RepID=UPI00266BC9A5|nr:interferon-induced protein 44-like [Hemibagrus wyckioides]